MNYKGTFRDKKDNLHTITISTKVGTGTSNIVLSTSPFVEELESDGTSIFKPCKYSSATVRILAKDYMWDIFQSKAQDVSVKLTDEQGNVEWTGFVTPNLYNMGYEADKEEIEVECIDALSTLQYFKYTSIESQPKTKSFLDIIKHILKDKTPYTYMYFPSFLEGITLDNLKVSEQNFFKEDDDDWTMQEVLEEICRYLNVTCVASGDSVYFLNYNALGKVIYMKYSIKSGTVESTSIDDLPTEFWSKTDTTIFTRSSGGVWHLLCQLENDAEGVIKLYAKHTTSTIWQELKFYIRYKNGKGEISINKDYIGNISYNYLDRIAIVRNSSGQIYLQCRNNVNRYDYTNVNLVVSAIGTGIKQLSGYYAGDVLGNWAYSVYADTKSSTKSTGDDSYVTYADLMMYQNSTAYTVDGNVYSDSGGTISLLPSYNRISVTSKINEYKELIPDVFNEKHLTNANGDWNKVINYTVKEDKMDRLGYAVRYRFVINKHYKSYYYNKSNGEPVSIDSCREYTDLQNYIGATLLQVSFADKEFRDREAERQYISQPNKKLNNYILIHQHDTSEEKLVFSTIASNMPETYIGKNTKMVIKGSIRCMDRQNWMYIPPKYSNNDDDFKRADLYLTCKLKWGDYYYYEWGGDYETKSGQWRKQESTFKLYFSADDTSHINNKEFSVRDTSGCYTDADLPTGCIIPIPEEVARQESIPEFSIYTRGRIDKDYRLDAIWLKDFSISLTIPKDSNIKEDDWETDTLYTNVINANHIEEGDDIECNINTWDNKVPTYSVVMYSNGETQEYLDTVKNLITGNSYRLEEHIIYDYITQYQQPSISLDISIKDRLKPYTVVIVPYISNTKRFIVDSYSRDYYSCNNNIKLVEKWNL